MKHAFFFCAILFASATLPTFADRGLESIVYNAPGAPVHIDSCDARLDDTDVGNVDYYFHPRASYTNVSAKNIKALRIKFLLMDGFDTPLATRGGIDSDGLTSGSSSHGSWEWIAFPEATSEVKCSLDRVKFTDGTGWSAKT